MFVHSCREESENFLMKLIKEQRLYLSAYIDLYHYVAVVLKQIDFQWNSGDRDKFTYCYNDQYHDTIFNMFH